MRIIAVTGITTATPSAPCIIMKATKAIGKRAKNAATMFPQKCMCGMERTNTISKCLRIHPNSNPPDARNVIASSAWRKTVMLCVRGNTFAKAVQVLSYPIFDNGGERSSQFKPSFRLALD